MCSKAMIDHMHGNYIGRQHDVTYPTDITRSTLGFHVYDNQARALTHLAAPLTTVHTSHTWHGCHWLSALVLGAQSTCRQSH